MQVLKFGGTSVGSAENIRRVFEIVKDRLSQTPSIVVIVSALGGVTDQLVKLSQYAKTNHPDFAELFHQLQSRHFAVMRDLFGESMDESLQAAIERYLYELQELLHGISLLKEVSPRSHDLLLSFGERLSARIVSAFFVHQGIDATYADTRDFIITDSRFGNASVDFNLTDQLIAAKFNQNQSINIVTGFIASDKEKATTTLGRGGSDYTAAIIASALSADVIEIWTDVDGMMTADPRKVKEAYTMPHLSYDEAMELCHFGAKVVYPPTILPAVKKQIPIRVRNTFNPQHPGSLIDHHADEQSIPVKGISSIDTISLVSLIGSGMVGVPGVASRLFGVLADHQINVILITQASSEHTITFAVKPEDAQPAASLIKSAFAKELNEQLMEAVEVMDDLSIVAVIGEQMKNTPGIAGRLFQALGRNAINVAAIAQGSSELNISVVINKSHLGKALNVLHEAFFLSNRKTINLFVMGTGLIGSTLLKQIKEQSAYLLREKSLRIRLCGIANSRNMYFDENGIDPDEWKEKIDFPGKNSSIERFVRLMHDFNLANSVFVDCTSNAAIIPHYEQILSGSVSIVTPNKLANSGKYADYVKLRKTAFDHGCKFLYETNVGAGLPIISTMHDMKVSGDKIYRIEGVLSGTLSFIFNSFIPGTRFSNIVREAQAKGLTEPDPRDDMNGKDVSRKLLILAREAGFQLEPEDICLTAFLPAACFEAPDVAAFYKELEKVDDEMSALCDAAYQNKKVLRLIAALEKGKATIRLQEIDADHPFYQLSGSDNIISFTSKRYHERPLVVKGPGAGAEVTAAGVFAEIISTAGHFLQDNYKFFNVNAEKS